MTAAVGSGAGMPYAVLVKDPALIGTTIRVLEQLTEARKKG